MCIAIYKPAHKDISEEVLRECFNSNKDGCGFAYINSDYLGVKRIKVYKSMNFDNFYHKYERATRLNPESPFIIHFRIATHGTVDKFNCHPFMIDHNTVFIHNGIISGVGKDSKKSDTQMFNEEVLQHINPDDLLYNSPIKKLIEKFVVGSKLVLLNVEGDVAIYNESSGNWNDGVWYSNYSWKKSKTTVTYTYTKHHLNEGSFYRCDECFSWHSLSTMRAFRNGIAIDVYCKHCANMVLEANLRNEISISQFVEYNNDLCV